LRIRPLTPEDLINIPARFQRNVLSTAAYAPNQVTVRHETKQNFTFDHVFGQECSQKEVYEHKESRKIRLVVLGKELALRIGRIGSGLEGLISIGADDGQLDSEPFAIRTGRFWLVLCTSSKTHTMGTSNDFTSPPESMGIIPRAMTSLFSAINSVQYKQRKFSMRVSFVEFYNEDLIDLLSEGSEEDKPQLLIREDPSGSISLSGLQEIKVNSVTAD
ncbi:3800_t:CDS:2, partial [Racocetra fulgida]